MHHLPNCYLGKLGIPLQEVQAQIRALVQLPASGRPYRQLFPTEKRRLAPRCNKFYYEPVQHPLLALVPSEARRVLSVGCGWGVTEEFLLNEGREVWGIPLDPVVAVSAQRRGVRTLPPDFVEAYKALGALRFDCVLFSNCLQHLKDPVSALRAFRRYLTETGVIVGSVPNTRRILMKRRMGAGSRRFRNYTSTLLHFTTSSMVRRWLKQAGFRNFSMQRHIEERHRRLHLFRLPLLEDLLASSLLFAASATRHAGGRVCPQREETALAAPNL